MNAPEHWRQHKLSDVCKLRGGAAFRPALQGNRSGQFPFIKVSDFSLSANWLKITDANNWVLAADALAIQGQPFPAGAVIFAKIGEALKQNRIRVATRETFIDNNLMGATPNQNSVVPEYLVHLFRTLDIASADVGTAVPYVKASTLDQWDLRLPPLHEQRRIASILGAYDDLLEVNRRRVAVLEAMARGLFEEWFVRFRFPGHENHKIIDTPDGRLPEGWTSSSVGDLLSHVARPTKVQRRDYLKSGPFPCIDQGAELIGGYTDDESKLITNPLPIIVFGDHTRILKLVNMPFACGADGTQLVHSKDRRAPVEYLYLALQRSAIPNESYARHFKFLKIQSVLLPPVELAQQFQSIVAPCFNMAQSLTAEMRVLASSRDLLLPRLISGELSVAAAECELEAAA